MLYVCPVPVSAASSVTRKTKGVVKILIFHGRHEKSPPLNRGAIFWGTSFNGRMPRFERGDGGSTPPVPTFLYMVTKQMTKPPVSTGGFLLGDRTSTR